MLPGETSARLVHGEADLLPGLVVDRYGDAAVLQTLVPATDRRKGFLAEVLANALSLGCVLERNDVRVRELEGLAQVKGVLRGADPGPVEYREGEVRMRLDLLAGQKTGAFLDQRENHLRAGAARTASATPAASPCSSPAAPSAWRRSRCSPPRPPCSARTPP